MGRLVHEIWVVFLEFLLAMTPTAPDVLLYLHIVLGIAIIGLAHYNFDGVRKTAVPGRVKRLAKTSPNLPIAMAIFGRLLLFEIGQDWTILFGVTVWGLILFIHVVNALAVITQAAAVAIAYDMWEDREFAKETAPEEVPVPPTIRWARLSVPHTDARDIAGLRPAQSEADRALEGSETNHFLLTGASIFA